MAVDVEKYGTRSVAEMAAARGQLSAMLAGLCKSPEFSDLLPWQQNIGDGEVVVLPVGIDEPRTLTLLVNWLTHALSQANRGWAGPHVRLRVAVHEGITMLADGVFGGPAVTKACRLLGALPLSAALASRPMVDLAVLFSDRIYADLGDFGRYLTWDAVTSVEICDPVARSQEVGWLLLSGREAAEGPRDAPAVWIR
jgi:hypothetical protein